MGLISWIVVGLLAGAIAGMVTGRRVGCLAKIAVGVIGALIGGALARAAGLKGISNLSLRSIVVAAIGATLFLFVLQAIDQTTGRRRW